MDLRQLRYFLEIVEQGSLTRASETLHVAQPALSFHLRNMEEHLGARLLFRGSTGVRPTEAGELLTRRARLILNEMARTEDEIRNLENDPSGQLRIGLPGTIGDIITLPLIQRLRQRYPRITFSIHSQTSREILGNIQNFSIDAGITYIDNEPVGKALTVPLYNERYVVERHVCVDTTAAGGNATLLAASAGE